MTFTKIAALVGVAFLGALCWLAALGLGIAREGLISLFALAVLVGGGNLLSGRSGHYGARAARDPGGGTSAGPPPAAAGTDEPTA